MIKSSRAFDANERVAEYRKSVAAVQENVLLFKGFLGPTVKDKPELTSVGHRAARAAGVVVDSLGKLRCPPGTPNANQFTDMQMSNCLMPSAETAARDVAKLSTRLIDGAKTILKNEKVRNVAKATAMIALQYYDAQYSDGMGSLTDTTLMSLAIFKSAGADALDFASDSLHKRGKLSDERKQKLDEINHNIKLSSDIAAKAFLLSMFKRKKDKKKDPKADPPSVKSPSGFKKGNSAIAKAKDFDPVIGGADANGRNIPRDLPTVRKDIDTVEKASEHLANGGKINELGDTVVLDAILNNIDVYDSEGNVSEIKRFELLGTGGGVVGMNRFRDRSTGQMFGVKYASRESMWDENVPHSKAPLTKGRADRWFEPVNEVLATSITEEFGYPASSLRVVQAKPEAAAMAVITDLVHNSYDGKILSASPEQLEKTDTRKLLHMQVMDVVMANGDRHSGNFLFSETPEGLNAVPIDHSFIFQVFGPYEKADKYAESISVGALGTELKKRHGGTVESHAKLVEDAGKVLQDIQKIDADALETRLLGQLDAMMEDRNLIGEYAMTPDNLNQLVDIQSDIRKSIQRLRDMQGMTPKELADIIVKPPTPKADSALEDLLNASPV
ncbi:Phosphatidylinositol 3-/4-kinase, catalytic domain containing protein [uncultured Caudovirales phage]|uniref:Phosphatidylinositol 3-/4-kinase, catalytic domain containing protein n=1 Tax=uncultured Caudovirales phage TaxID=2100421 RepID=A0A6J5MJB0_9CAUD|nr:Phosphatidylinositol 3-/4-kinase, catalytic domain containing protein [uncultured Caudovirales phage]CAB4156029.1 Phosphatidylinositol 3-/4-kinase, catalytic domain containing protein [uncultured Caudovirales phage]CAB4160277.1 Phosphatidylinositol 3-/4-kinase, catalytic domain containing protein [uncultured Caudovirales phage]CAB4164699.1 Phosphatidylinositol 3-/4-kinase, catalytic domain containing protein [uncultured Caudovirales phage]CAB4171864.1 Phosphatidylinositol 3-/4-kinase, cataly